MSTDNGMYFLHDSTFGLFNSVACSNQADFTFMILPGGLGYIDLTTGVGLHVFNGFAAYQ